MLLAGFWWGDKGTKKMIHWKQWDKLCCFKLNGGVGFKDLECFNLALLARQWWRLIQHDKSLCHKVLKAKYFPRSDPSKALKGFNPSYLWSSLMEGKKVIDQGAIYLEGWGWEKQ